MYIMRVGGWMEEMNEDSRKQVQGRSEACAEEATNIMDSYMDCRSGCMARCMVVRSIMSGW